MVRTIGKISPAATIVLWVVVRGLYNHLIPAVAIIPRRQGQGNVGSEGGKKGGREVVEEVGKEEEGIGTKGDIGMLSITDTFFVYQYYLRKPISSATLVL